MTDTRVERIENKLDQVVEKISSIDRTLAEQHISLKEHIKRSDMLEKKMEPLEKHVSMVNGIIKLIGLMALMAAIADGIVSILTFLRK